MSKADLTLAAISRRQFAAFAWRQAREAGLHDTTIAQRLGRGRYRELLPGVLAEAGAPDRWEARAMAALLAVGGEAVLARGSAARVLDLDVPPPALEGLHVLVRQRTFPKLPGVTVHRTRNLTDEDMTRAGPLATTTAPRTIVDLAGELGPIALRRTVAHAVRRELTGPTELRILCRRLGRIRGKRQLLALVDELSPLDRDCRSELETRFLRLMRGEGLVPTAMNHPVVDANGQRRLIDAVYLPERVPVELDSRLAHGTLLDWHDDLRRENAIVLTGWRPFLRFSWADVTQRPDEVVTLVRRALAAATSERLTRS